ncbi:chemotaxis protein CheY [Robbsia andropogonis]|uniref:Chemotaxis protein CheY n=1 Tax=Robbsia andropogonis TaxID=28092 RepID=A0A0F5K242_9BURK|nr:response regulator [Robbsia andropogonis]KKB64186.1 chemotaxis protein CheY [Robbsia andropogonis]MCP1118733.1 response regulator [Robbsia andropogonis]MCP1128200.1 response regulator [Robbsia andropogonis]
MNQDITTKPTVLAVDDSPAMRLILDATLEAAGYQVTLAEDGREGLAKAVAATAVGGRVFDLVLTDHNMPGLTGLELIAGLRHLAPYAETPILLLTTEDGEDFKAAAREAGATGWLLKPLDPQVLTEVLVSVRGAIGS